MNNREREYLPQIENALKAVLPSLPVDSPCAAVVEAMRYSLLSGGKRVRPMLALAFCELCGGTVEEAMPFACAVEMVHTYSLIHDDLPCMDNDDFRRGKPANHKVYGEAMALLAGDAMLTAAFETALTCKDPQKAARGAKVLAQCAGACGMVGGQCIDLQSGENELTIPLLQAMDQGKTVALISAACRMGCIAAGVSQTQEDAAGRYAEGLGMAFQIRDDILDVLGDAHTLGKNVGMDAQNGKRNYISLLGVEKSQELVRQYTEQALAALNEFPEDTTFLRELALRLAEREN